MILTLFQGYRYVRNTNCKLFQILVHCGLMVHARHIKNINHSMLFVTSVYLRDIPNMIFFIFCSWMWVIWVLPFLLGWNSEKLAQSKLQILSADRVMCALMNMLFMKWLIYWFIYVLDSVWILSSKWCHHSCYRINDLLRIIFETERWGWGVVS